MKSSLPNSLFGVSCELTRRLLSCRWNSPSIDESHRATQFLPQNKCRNLNSQCLGQQPTSEAGDGGYYYFECAIIIFSSHCLPTFLTCLTWFPTAFTDGVLHMVPELSKSRLYTVLFASLSWPLSWIFGCLHCLVCKTELPTSLLVQSCSLHHGINISVLPGPAGEVAGPVPSTRLSGGVTAPGQLHQDAAEPGRCSLQVGQGRVILTLVTHSLSQWKQFSPGYEARRKARKIFPSGLEGKGQNKALLECRAWGWLPVQNPVISF